MALLKRLVPSVSHNTLIVPGLVVGFINGALQTLAWLILLRNPDLPLAWLLLFAPTTLIAIIWGCLAQDQRSMIKGSTAVSVGTVLWHALSSQYSSTDGCLLLLDHFWHTNMGALMRCFFSGAGTWIVMIAIGFCARGLICRTNCQPGPPAPARWCWKCRYSLTGLNSDQCPECGTSTASPHLGHPLRDLYVWLHERRRWTAIAFVLAFVTFEFQIVRSRTLPTLAFVRAMSPQAQRVDPSQIVGHDARPFVYAIATGCSEGWHIAASYPESEHRMRLILVKVIEPATNERPARVSFGQSQVFMRLDSRQAQHVIDRGVPASAIEAIVEKGRAVGWPEKSRSYWRIEPEPYFAQAPSTP